MNALKVSLIFLLLMAGVFAGGPDENGISGRFFNAPVTDLLVVHARISGQPIAASAEVKAIKAGINLSLKNESKAGALRRIEQALLEQAGVQISRETDGSVLARKVGAK